MLRVSAPRLTGGPFPAFFSGLFSVFFFMEDAINRRCSKAELDDCVIFLLTLLSDCLILFTRSCKVNTFIPPANAKDQKRPRRRDHKGNGKPSKGIIVLTTETIKQTIRENGVDLVAVADAGTLLTAFPPRPATALMPSARSVIVMAVAHSLGAVYAPDIMLWTRNKMQTSRVLDAAAEKIGRMLEAEGFLALPVSADKPVEIHKTDPVSGKKFSQTKVLGHLSLKHAAVSCGLGEIGASNLLLTPEFGPHQRLGGIITEAPLDSDPPRALNLCDNCGRCRKACPSRALGGDRYDADPCFNYWAYGFKRRFPRKLREVPGFLKMLAAHNRRRDMLIETGQTYITDVDNCIECMRACPVGSRWKKIRPGKMLPQKSFGTE
jgi:epoxyqueuosine reductase